MEKLYLPYPEFKLGEVIDPQEVNTNNSDLEYKVNQIVDRLNSIFDDGDGGVIDVEIRGDIVSIKPISPFTSDNVQDFLSELMERLQSSVELSGASLIGAEELEGIDGDDVQSQLTGIYELMKELTSDENMNAALELHKASGDHDERYYKKDELDEVLELLEGIANGASDDASDALEKVEKLITDLGGIIGGGGGGDISFSMNKLRVLDEDPEDPEVGEIWMLSYTGGGGEEDGEGDSEEEGEEENEEEVMING